MPEKTKIQARVYSRRDIGLGKAMDKKPTTPQNGFPRLFQLAENAASTL
jgi:hypothetical protein